MAKAEWRKSSKTTDPVEQKAKQSIPQEIARPSQSFDAKDSETKDLPTRKRTPLDPLTQALNEVGYMMNARFVWLAVDLFGKRNALTVDRYYQDNKLAIDLTPQKPELVSIKQNLCRANGVIYFNCVNAAEIETMLTTLPTMKESMQTGSH